MKWGRFVFAVAAAAAAVAACSKDYASDEPDHEVEAGIDASTAPTTPDAAAPVADASTAADAGSLAVLQVELGDLFGCALLSDHSVWCWGDNEYGQLAASPPGSFGLPPQKVPIDGVTSITAGGNSVCAVKADASLWCWGDNSEGQLGHDPALDSACATKTCDPTPMMVPKVFAASATVNTYNGCAVTTNATVLCWGRNDEGQCGVPFSGVSGAVGPTALPLVNIIAVRNGDGALNVCAIDKSHRAWCWGRNSNGELGHNPGDFGDLANGGAIYNDVPVPVQIGDAGVFGGIADISTGLSTCLVQTTGKVWCFGRNTGNLLVLDGGDTLAHPMPVFLRNLPTATAIRVGVDACAIVDGGSVYCWGPVSSDLVAGERYDAGCTTTTGTVSPCTDPAPVAGAVLSTLDVAQASAGGLPLDGGAPLTWGSSALFNRLGHPDQDASLPPMAMPVVGLP